MKRNELADLMLARIEPLKDQLAVEFAQPRRVKSYIVDDLLPEEIARRIFEAFPTPEAMMRKHSLRESKFVAAQLNKYDPILEEVTFAFQDPRLIKLFADTTGLPDLLPDPRLYAGGISSMTKGCFLTPHLDNSHDGQQKNYRVLNTLYYVTPNWREEYGGNLELWDGGLEAPRRTIHSKFNRLVMMATHRGSWHSVSPIVHEGRRCCVSNYFFREKSPEAADYFHATSFRGWPEQKLRDLVLRADARLRTAILSVINVPTKHIYDRK